MKHIAAISLIAGALLFATSAGAQTPITPPAAKSEPKTETKAAPKAEPKSDAKKSVTKKPAAPESKPTPLPAASATPTPIDPNADLVYGAFQRGEYKTTLDLALPRAQAGDPKAMTMIGEIYSNGFGVKRDFPQAADWYKRASDARGAV